MFGSKSKLLAILVILSPFTSVSALAMPIIPSFDFTSEPQNMTVENSKNSSSEQKKSDA